MSLCASELGKDMQIETLMDEITLEEVNIWSWESVGEDLGIHLESSEERSIWTMKRSDSGGYGIPEWRSGASGEARRGFYKLHEDLSEEHKRGLKRLIRGRHLVGRRGISICRMMTAAVTEFI